MGGVAEKLGCGWSPPPVSGRLRVLFPGDDAMRVCLRPSTDGSIPASRAANAGPDACRAATGGGASMRAVGCRGSLSPEGSPSPSGPPEADDRSGFGHWEADSVIGMGCDLHTEAERRTRFLMARVIPDKTAERSVGARLAMFAPLPAAARLSVTHDNGTGFARHARLRDEPGMATYFADPYSSWQRGGNENRNGMIRRYLPKRTIIEPGMARELQEIVDETDNRPMRALGHRTPAEAFADELPDLQL